MANEEVRTYITKVCLLFNLVLSKFIIYEHSGYIKCYCILLLKYVYMLGSVSVFH